MGSEEIHNKADEWKGAAKETFGDVTDNEDLEAEGAAEKQKAKAKQALEDAKDKVQGAAELARDKARSTFGS
jgi:uncharacterized protein YjbJ (UPF0337 family)